MIWASFYNTKWIIGTTYPQWQKTLEYWNQATRSVDVKEYASNVAQQAFFEDDEGIELTNDIRDYINTHCLLSHGVTFKLGKRLLAWNIEYMKHGWQAIHNHRNHGAPRIASVVLCLQGEVGSGTFYFAQPEPDGSMRFGTIEQVPGTLIISDGDVWHGAYPCTTNKKVFVFDFELDS
tara:strand:+ start:1488 stop:2021 length:534 start_codon:yes stop_codon:yes gene_type:complete